MLLVIISSRFILQLLKCLSNNIEKQSANCMIELVLLLLLLLSRLRSNGERIGNFVAVVREVHLVSIPGGKAVMFASPTAVFLVAGNVA